MTKPRLTKKQQKMVAELKHLTSTLGLDFDKIITEADPEARTTLLELARDQLTRSAVILKYVLMDEFLSAVICWHYFGKKGAFPNSGRQSASSLSTTSSWRSCICFRSWTSLGVSTTPRSGCLRISQR